MRTAPSTCVLGVGILIALAALVPGCTASAADVRPPADQLFFPTGVAVAPDDSVVFVASSNSQLRYDSGTIDVIDLAVVQPIIDAWRTGGKPGSCSPDPDHRETLICDEAPLIRASASIRTGNFATDIAVQNFGPSNYRVFVPTRGDPSVAWADYSGDNLVCSPNVGSFDQCDDTHRLTAVLADPDMTHIADEPFGVFATADPATGAGFAVVTHQTNGAVTLIDSPVGSNAVISDIRYNDFNPDLTTGLRGSTGVTGRTGIGGDAVYVGSRTDPRVQTYTVDRPPNGAPPILIDGNYFYLNGVGTGAQVGGSADTRGMQFSPDGSQLYLTNREPPSLQVFDASVDASGASANKLIAATDICRDAAALTSIDLSSVNGGTRVYLTCFDDGQLYVIDPSGLTQVEDIIEVGRGPYAVAAAPTRKLLFVSNFLEDTIAVIDVDPTSANHNRVVLRIGIPKPPEST